MPEVKDYPSLGMKLQMPDRLERRKALMAEVDQLPMALAMFDELERQKLADTVGDMLEELSETVLNRAVEVGRSMGDAQAYSLIVLFSALCEGQVGTIAHTATEGLAIVGTQLLDDKFGPEKAHEMLKEDFERRSGEIGALLGMFGGKGR